jgi:peptidoglycan/LPS O-acetylase OafA/YrhL
MKLRLRDLFATLLVLAVGAPYALYLATGDLPTSIGDFGGLAFVGLVLGSAAFLVQSKGDPLDRPARMEELVAAVAFLIGLLALVFSEAAVAEVLLAVFMGAIFVVWALEMLDHLTADEGARKARPTGARRAVPARTSPRG